MLIMVLVAAFLLVRKGADFSKARPTAQHPTIWPTADVTHKQ